MNPNTEVTTSGGCVPRLKRNVRLADESRLVDMRLEKKGGRGRDPVVVPRGRTAEEYDSLICADDDSGGDSVRYVYVI